MDFVEEFICILFSHVLVCILLIFLEAVEVSDFAIFLAIIVAHVLARIVVQNIEKFVHCLVEEITDEYWMKKYTNTFILVNFIGEIEEVTDDEETSSETDDLEFIPNHFSDPQARDEKGESEFVMILANFQEDIDNNEIDYLFSPVHFSDLADALAD